MAAEGKGVVGCCGEGGSAVIGGIGVVGNVGELTGESPRRLNSLPNSFFAPGVFLGVLGVAGVPGIGVRCAGVAGAGVCGNSSEVRESAEEVGV